VFLLKKNNKSLIGVGIIVSLLLSLSACSSKPQLKLESSKVLITNDEGLNGAIGITTGPNKGQKLVPTDLYYKFKIDNIGSYFDKQNPIKVKIIPKETLINTSKEVIGFNIFKASNYMNTGLGTGLGTGYTSGIQPKENGYGQFTLSYELGVSKRNNQTELLVPSNEKLNKLKNNALNAYLVVTQKGKEITRFDLSK
jgi:hypothetical protein